MRYVDNVVELIGNTPLVRLRNVTEGIQATVLAKVEYLNPGGSVKDRIALRMVEEAEKSGLLQPGRHHRRADQRQHRRRAGPGRAAARATSASSSARTRSARTSATCCGRTAPRWWSARPRSRRRTRARTTTSPTGWPARSPAPGSPTSTRNPANPLLALRDDRPGDLGADRRPDHPLRGRRRHRRHHLRRRPLPQGGLRRHGAGHRRRPRGLGLLRRHRPALPGRGRRRGLLAADVRPRRSATRSSRSPTRTPST